MQRIDEYNSKNAAANDVYKPNLKGFMVGNGVTNWKYDADPAFVEQAYWFGLVDDVLYHQMKTCNYEYYQFTQTDPTKVNATCNALMDKFNGLMTQIQHYDLFGVCYYFNDTAAPQMTEAVKGFRASSGAEKEGHRQTLLENTLRPIDYASFKYRNRPNYKALKDTPSCGTYDGPLLTYFRS